MSPSPDASTALAVRDQVQKFFTAALSGELEDFKNLAKQLDDGKGIPHTVADVKDANKRGALHFAARGGQTEMCKYLVEELKLDVNMKDEDGDTPLLHAARQGQTATAMYLVKQGGDPTIPSELGATALHHASGIGEIELLRSLLSEGVDVNLQSDSGTPLIWAAGNGQTEAVKLLLEHNANPNYKTEDDVTPLLAATAAGSLPCLELLIQAGAYVNVIAGGVTPLHIACDQPGVEMINCLLIGGADPNVTDEEGLLPIQTAAATRNREAVEILFKVTSPSKSISDWSVNGILKHMQEDSNDSKEQSIPQKNGNQCNNDLKEVSPEVKKKAAEAKARGDDAFRRKDFSAAIDAYTQAIDFDPTEGTFFSNRSLCWFRLGQSEHALADAKTCRALRPDWPKACYREGAALRQMQKFEDAAIAFFEGVQLDPDNMELVSAYREAVETGRKLNGTEAQKS